MAGICAAYRVGCYPERVTAKGTRVLGVSSISTVLLIALYIGGCVVAILLRRRDPTGGLLAALGFGCMLLTALLSIGQGVAISASIQSSADSSADVIDRMQAISMIFGLVIGLVRLAGFALVFAGLLHVIRRPPAATGVGAMR